MKRILTFVAICAACIGIISALVLLGQRVF